MVINPIIMRSVKNMGLMKVTWQLQKQESDRVEDNYDDHRILVSLPGSKSGSDGSVFL